MHAPTLPLDGDAFEAFLHQLGVELERQAWKVPQDPQDLPARSRITLLQQSLHHEAFYRVDLIGTQAHLLILLPTEQPLVWEGYLVLLHASHPLAHVLEHLVLFHGSTAFEQERHRIEERLVYACAESMKKLFWAGHSCGQFPDEIVVRQYRLVGIAADELSG